MKKNRQPEEINYKLKFTLLAAAFAVVFIGSLVIGRYAIPPADLVKIVMNSIAFFWGQLTGQTVGFEKTWQSSAEIIALNVRLPRVVAAGVVGAALSAAGASYQGMFRNPMAAPDVLGASTGAGFGAALGILLGFNYVGLSISSFCFGLGAVFLAYVISRASRLHTVLAMVLAGIIVSWLFQAGTSFIKLVADTENQLPAITYWLMGSLNSISGSDAIFVSVLVVSGLLPLMALRWRINILTLSEDEAGSLGINTTRLRFIVIVCATLMTAASVSVSGVIGWVGLVIPHCCRILFGHDYRRLMPASVILGAIFMILVDNLARTVSTTEIPLGILTAFAGAPVFIWMILRGGTVRED